MLGMSLVTTNRAVRTLRTEGCAVIGSGRLEVLNWRRLQARAGFDPAYLIAEQ